MSGAHVHDEIEACVDGALSEARRAAVLAHAATCSDCGVALERASRLQRALEQLPVPDPGAAYWTEFASRVEARLPGAATESGAAHGPARVYERLLGWLAQPSRFGWMGVAGAIAAATLVVYVGLRGFHPREAQIQMPAPAPAPAPEPAPAPPPRPSSESAPAQQPPASIASPQLVASERQTPRVTLPAAPRPNPARTRRKDATQAAGAPAAATAREPVGKESGVLGKATAVEPDMPVHDDPIAGFVRAAVAGDRVAANAAYAALAGSDFAGIAPQDAENLRRWATSSEPQPGGVMEKFVVRNPADAMRAAPPGTSTSAAAPAPSAFSASRPESALQPVFDAKPQATVPDVEPLLDLEALAWPRRSEPALRASLAQLADDLARLAPQDARAADRAGVLAAWLAESSTSRQERERWDTLRQNIPRR